MNERRGKRRGAASRTSIEGQESTPSSSNLGMPRSLGAAIRHARRKQEVTLEQVARKSKLSVSYLSQVERDRMAPSLSALKRIAQALDIPAGTLMFSKSDVRRHAPVAVVRQTERKRLVFPGSAIRYEMLTPDLRRRASLLWLHAPAGAESGTSPFSHDGEDAVVVLQGRLSVEVGGVWHELSKGDSIYFDSQLPHRWRNATGQPAVAIWLSTPPSF